jgi:WD40 repeat protein
VVTGATDGAVRIHRRSDAALVRTLLGHEAAVKWVAWSPTGTTIASGDVAGKVHVWDATSGERLATIAADAKSVRDLAYGRDGGEIWTVGVKDGLRRWSVDGAPLPAPDVGERATAVAIHPSEDWVAVAAAGGIHRVDLGEPARVSLWIPLEGELPFAMVFSHDGARLAWLRGDGTVRVHDVTKDEDGGGFQVDAKDAFAFAFAPGSRRLHVADGNGAVSAYEERSVGVRDDDAQDAEGPPANARLRSGT